MIRRRRCLVTTATLWLLCQVAAVAVSPFVRCCDNDHAVRLEHECCEGLPPGTPCSRHGHGREGGSHREHGGFASAPAPHGHAMDQAAHDALPIDEPAFRCLCRIPPEAIAAMFLSHAVLPVGLILPAGGPSARAPAHRFLVETHVALLDPPPPRA